jgi:uncharacterized protein YecE (DUF72 family)
VVYPADLRPSDWLGYYARHFDTVELNSAFYRMPSLAAFDGWRGPGPRPLPLRRVKRAGVRSR